MPAFREPVHRDADRVIRVDRSRRPGRSAHTRGPHTGQALGWAWKRRSRRGRRIRAGRRGTSVNGAHSGTGAVVGDVLDDGVARAAVGAVDEGVAVAAVARGRASRARQSAQVAMSGVTRALFDSRTRLSAMEKPSWPAGSISLLSSVRIVASGGNSSESAFSKRPSASAPPSTSIVTPRESFQTRPESRSRAASRYTNGRKPTPWTVPVTTNRMRLFSLEVMEAIPCCMFGASSGRRTLPRRQGGGAVCPATARKARRPRLRQHIIVRR